MCLYQGIIIIIIYAISTLPQLFLFKLSLFIYFQSIKNDYEVGWLCFTSHRQRGNLETAPVPPFTVPCEGREAR